MRATGDFTLDDNLGAATFGFFKAHPNSFEFHMISELTFLPGLNVIRQPGVHLTFRNFDRLSKPGRHPDHNRDIGRARLAISLIIAIYIREILPLETSIDTVSETSHEKDRRENEEFLHKRGSPIPRALTSSHHD